MALTLQDQIKEFYDASSGLWEQIWGEHMHHGYYGPNGDLSKDRYQAQVDLIDELLRWSQVKSAHQILDVGCGIGGASLYLANKFDATAHGITLSPIQANRAEERALALQINAQFSVADALAMPFEDESFDLVWSLESGEHMPDKKQFMNECCRVLKPGGRFVMAVWCHRPTDLASGGLLTKDERKHLEKIYQVYCLPYVISLPDFEAIAQDLPYANIQTADWSTAVSPFWSEVVASAFSPAAVVGLIKAGPKTIQAALSMGLMQRGYARGLVRFGVLSATRL
jgi:tocopherol O-methyltransferase